jgi:undecaprenyl-diphosphatase
MRLSSRELTVHASIFAVWLAVCGAFFALAVWADGTYYLPFDKEPSIRVQDLESEVADRVFGFVNTLGHMEWVAVALVLLFSALMLRRRYVEAAVVGGAGAMRFALLAARNVIERPFSWDTPPEPVRVFPNNDSFPSGHVLGEVLAYTLIFVFVSRVVPWRPVQWAVRLFCVFVIALGGPARLYVGAHWTSDVIGSFLLAAMYLIPALQLYAIYGQWRSSKREREQAMASGVVTPFRVRTERARIEPEADAAREAPR